ncbi:DUF2971 domain-containing protein [Nitrospirillum iridis]|uniref:DUF2971 domain-containing protein n=1 Tax=Nitrospirillum iridis TaxID=765888 RepID=A0A7X0AUF1_9PROT|nr:DUF2971 domain-containing protein [Nitrospirillum iridis]MBB6249521.1 hypothetical protein [Nitrospirillum iridis]
MEKYEIQKLFYEHYDSIANLAAMEARPSLLAHYTSLSAIECILKSNEIWFANPLFMNDFQEVRFGFIEGRNLVDRELMALAQVSDDARRRVPIFLNAFMHYFKDYDENRLFNLFIFCLSEFDRDSPDGRLSMWRGYGGNGSGAAIVFRTDFVNLNMASPFLICRVSYGTDEARLDRIRSIVTLAKEQVAGSLIPDDQLYVLAYETFHILRLFALTSKHHGFSEEREWRVIYLPERDTPDRLSEYLTYIVGKGGVEPRLRHPLKPINLPDGTTYDWSFEDVVDRILLGPSQATPLAIKGFAGMLKALKRDALVSKIAASQIPFRATDR